MMKAHEISSIELKSLIRDVPDFPKPGVIFKDIGPLLGNPSAFQNVISEMIKPIPQDVDFIAGIESRGFIFASAIAERIKKGFLPIRKSGKLPPPVLAVSYQLEYGEATIEVSQGRGKVWVVDDVLATGGTIRAAIELLQISGYHVSGAGVFIDLRFLNQLRFNDQPLPAVLHFD